MTITVPSIYDLTNNYENVVSKILRPSKNPKYTALDIYAGAGGLSLGLEAAGFTVTGIDDNPDCTDTYNSNLKGTCVNDHITPQYDFPKDVDILVGGPPCQPFSVRGKQRGKKDTRNGIPSFIHAVKKIKPKMWLFENVRGILYKNRDYFMASMKKLEQQGYHVNISVLNCLDYGVPQNRQRVIAVGYLDGKYTPPLKKFDTYITAGDALKNIPKKDKEKPTYLTVKMDKYIATYEAASHCKQPRDLAKDRPARTLTCKNLGGYTSDMHRIRTRNGKRRILFAREAARLQGFPDWFEFSGSKSSKMTQIGNALPPMFALAIGAKLAECIESTSM